MHAAPNERQAKLSLALCTPSAIASHCAPRKLTFATDGSGSRPVLATDWRVTPLSLVVWSVPVFVFDPIAGTPPSGH